MWKVRFAFVLCLCVAVLAVVAALRFAVFSLMIASSAVAAPPPPLYPLYRLSPNATEQLRVAGFSMAAEVLTASPASFFSTTASTIFAVKDSALPAADDHLWRMRLVLPYHTSPVGLPMKVLSTVPLGSCFPTLIVGKNLLLTDAGNGSLGINGVRISHPDLILDGSVVIHGVLQRFSFREYLCAGRRNSSLSALSVDFRD